MTKKVLFKLPSEFVAGAAQGILLGEFNNWSIEEGISLERTEDGSMMAELHLTPGKTYEYRYLLSDGRWVNDNNAKTSAEVFGYPVENCVLSVPAEEKKAAAPKAKATAVKPKAVKKEAEAPAADDLTKIEGIGKQIAALLVAEKIVTFKDLSKATAKNLKTILEAAGSKFNVHEPTTWPKQAKLAAAAKWDELAKLQDELKGGK